MFAFQNKSSMVRVGERNVEATKAKLKQLNIPILAEDTGGKISVEPLSFIRKRGNFRSKQSERKRIQYEYQKYTGTCYADSRTGGRNCHVSDAL